MDTMAILENTNTPTPDNPPIPGSTPTSSLNYAPFGKRFLAALADGVIVGVPLVLFAMIIAVMFGPDNTTGEVMADLLTYVVAFGYQIYFIGKSGQTLGKKLLKIKVVKKDNPQQHPDYVGAFLREVVGKMISSLVLSIGYLWALWDKDKQAWHDKIAGTVVIEVS